MMSAFPIAIALLGAHPGLYYEPADVANYQAQASTSRLEIATSLKAGATYLSTIGPADVTFEPDRGLALVALSVTCMLTADPSTCQSAHRWVTQAMSLVDPSGQWEAAPDFVQANYLLGFAVAYDVLSDSRLPSALSTSEQAQLRSLIGAGCAYFYNLSVTGQLWYAQDWSQNHNWTDYGSLGVAALSVLGEVPAAQTWLDHAVADYGNVQTVLNRISDGTWHEGYSYEGSSIASWVWFAAAIRHAKQAGRLGAGVQDFTDTPWLRAFGSYRAVGSLPGRAYQNILMHGDFFGWSSDEAVMSLRYAAARFADTDAAWVAQRQLVDMPHNTYGPEQNWTALEYLVFDPSVAASQPAKLDVSLNDLAGAISRSGYDANAAVLGVKAGAFGGLGNWNAMAAHAAPGGELNFGHDHVDDLGFWFYANGQWLAPEAAGYVLHPTPDPSYPLAYDTRFHNTLTVDGVGQLGDDGWAQGSTLSPQIDFSRTSAVVANVSLPDLAYLEMEGAHLYPASLGLDQVRRQVLFVDRRTVVIRDQLHAAAAHTFQWNSHAMNGAVQDGSWVRGVGLNDQALGVRVLSPSSWTFSSDVQTTQQINSNFDATGAMTHFAVANATPASSARFLVAMEPTTSSGWAGRPDIQPLGAADTGSGLLLPDGTAWVLGDAPNANATAGGLTLVGTAGAVRSSSTDARYVLVRGSSLLREGSQVLSGDAAEGALEAHVQNGKVDIQAVYVTRARVFAPGATAATWNGAAVTLSGDVSDGRYVFIPALGTPPIDACIPPLPTGIDAGMGTDAGAGWGTGPLSGQPSVVAASAGSGGPGPTPRVRGNCSATGNQPWVLSALTLLGLIGANRHRTRRP